MAALLVSIAVMTVLMSVAMPVWRHEAQREKEEELIWRGQQYIRAIRLFQAKTGTFPTSVDMLVQGRYIRKKFKDPITNDEFQPIGAGSAVPGQTGGPGQPLPGRGAGGGAPGGGPIGRSGGAGGINQPISNVPPSNFGPSSGFGASSGGMVAGGLMGVVSKSKDESIRLYNGRNHYNEWVFMFVAPQPGGIGGRGVPGGPGGFGLPGGPGGGRGGRGGRGGIDQPGGPGRGGREGPGNPFRIPGPGGPGRGRGF
jgi:type II secretory pathway pseudopilin PulG